MKKLCCMIALAAISFGTVYASIPVKSKVAVTDTTKMKKKTTAKKKKMKKDTTMKKM